MTTDVRADARLAGLLEELYLGAAPAYRDEVLANAVQQRQRPAWSFPGRWLPMADIASRPAFVSSVPWRTVGLALLLIALLAATIAVVGSRRQSVPAPFGLAANGVIAWALDGDIYTGDPATETVRAVVTTPDIDRNPQFSRDGSRLAFLRQVPAETGRFDLVTTAADGTGTEVLSTTPFGTPESVQWAPDGRSILVLDADLQLTRFFLDGSPLATLLQGVHLEPDAFRPPDGAEVLYERDAEPGTIYALRLEDSSVRQLFNPATAGCECEVGGPARWSPDGSKIAVTMQQGLGEARMYVMNADGTGLRQLAFTEGTWVENDPAWSPDGTRIAFNRWRRDDAGDWFVQPIAIVAIDTVGSTPIGIGPASEGALIEWAPDGESILTLPGTLLEAYTWSPGAPGTIARPTFIDLAEGTSRQLDWSVGSNASWQRVAP
jgi:Tol biopolymer transport system component